MGMTRWVGLEERGETSFYSQPFVVFYVAHMALI